MIKLFFFFLLGESSRLVSVFDFDTNVKSPIGTHCPQIFHTGEWGYCQASAAERILAA